MGRKDFFSSLTLTILVFERMLRLPVKVALTNGDAGRGTDRAHNVWPKHGSTPCIPSINCLFIYF